MNEGLGELRVSQTLFYAMKCMGTKKSLTFCFRSGRKEKSGRKGSG